MTDSLVPTVANVLAVFHGAHDHNVSEGMEWYADANAYALDLSYRSGIPFVSCAGIIAALSPMNGWENNKRKAAQLLAQNGDGTGCGLSNNVRKAVAIYNGADPLDILKGDKVRAFYRTIVDPMGDIDPVIDRHAFDIAVGMRTDDKARGILGRKGTYELFAAVYREAARIAGIGSAQMQAITWVAWREANGIIA